MNIWVRLGLCFSLAGCTVGDVTDSPGNSDVDGGQQVESDAGPDAALATFSMEVDQAAASLTLGTSAEFVVTLTSDGFVGPVDVAVPTVPADWTVTMEPAGPVNLTLDGQATVTITVDVPSDAATLAGGLDINASSGTLSDSTPVTLEVENTLIVRLADGTADGSHAWPAPATFLLGAKVRFVNMDSVDHRIHANNEPQGFDHQPDNMVAAPSPGEEGGDYLVTINTAGTFQFYCHINAHGANSGLGALQAVAVE